MIRLQALLALRLNTTSHQSQAGHPPHRSGPLEHQSLCTTTRKSIRTSNEEQYAYISTSTTAFPVQSKQPNIQSHQALRPLQPQESITRRTKHSDRQDGTSHHDHHPSRRDFQRHHLCRRRAETMAIAQHRRRQQVQPAGTQVSSIAVPGHWQADAAEVRVS